MMARQAGLLVADEIYYNLYGKATLQGVYHGDITIPADPAKPPQLIFYFMAEADLTDAFRSLTAEVTLPESSPVEEEVRIIPPEVIRNAIAAGEDRAFYRYPLLLRRPVLHPGKIKVRMIHESGEIVVGAPSIVLVSS